MSRSATRWLLLGVVGVAGLLAWGALPTSWVAPARPSVASAAPPAPGAPGVPGAPGASDVRLKVGDRTVRLTPINSRFYRIYSDVSAEQLRYFAQQLDATYAEYRRRFSKFRAHGDDPLPVYLFRTQDEYLAFMDAHQINAKPTAGIFFVQPDITGLATWVAGRNRRAACQVLQHEGFHQFAFHHISPHLPIWLNEGLAVYFEDGVMVRGTMRLGFIDGERLMRLRQARDDHKLKPLSDLLALTNDQWLATVQSDPDAAGILYDQAWSVVLFLSQSGGIYTDALYDLLTDLAHGKTQDQALAAFIKRLDLRRLEHDWLNFLATAEPDPISTAVGRMEFLGDAIEYLRQNHYAVPPTLGDLRAVLQRMGFRATRSRGGVVQKFDARQSESYQYGQPGPVRGVFQFLPSEGKGLPPRITAPRLSPQPSLTWYADDDGELVADIVFE